MQWAIPVVAAVVAAFAIRLRLRFAASALDVPGHRSLHERPTPHGGGVGIVAAILLLGWWLAIPAQWLLGVAVLAALSWVDDHHPLPFWLRLPVHLLVAGGVVFLQVDALTWGAFIMAGLIAWSINAYNFMDGADGLAGSMAVAGFGAYAVAFALAQQPTWAIFCCVIVAASVVFLCFNWHPAQIFMGDIGSIPLGFLAGGLGWLGVELQCWPAWFPLMAFAPFWLDASVTLVRRLCRGERVWEAHREHYYQRMVRSGLTHAQMTRRWAGLMGAGGGLAGGLLLQPAFQTVGLMAWSLVLLWFGLRLDRQWENKNK